MFFRASFKPARSTAKTTPEFEQLGAFMSAVLADKYYGETIVSIKFVYCVAAAEATRIGVKRVYDCHFEIGVALEATAAMGNSFAGRGTDAGRGTVTVTVRVTVTTATKAGR